jgi:DNA polymerase bacteriophage-type
VTVLHIDFETRSACDLRDRGLDVYADDPTTDVWCMGFCWDDADAHVLHDDALKEVGGRIVGREAISEHVKAGGLVVAHNAAFELAIWNRICAPRYGFPAPRSG